MPRTVLTWLAIAGGAVLLFVGLLEGSLLTVSGSILIGSGLIASALNRP